MNTRPLSPVDDSDTVTLKYGVGEQEVVYIGIVNMPHEDTRVRKYDDAQEKEKDTQWKDRDTKFLLH